MKTEMHFNTLEEMHNYYPNGVPSTVIALIGKNEAIFTTSNNYISEGVPKNQGGEIMSPETEAEMIAMQQEIDSATGMSYDIKEGTEDELLSTIEVHNE